MTWPDGVLMEEAARLIAKRGREVALHLFQEKQEPDATDKGLLGQATRAAYARIVAADREAKAKANDSAFAALIEQGAFQG